MKKFCVSAKTAGMLTVLFLIVLISSTETFAQMRKKSVAAPRFIGSPETQKAAFKSFIIKNTGKRVYLKLTFDEIPVGYKSGVADPVFYVDNFSYWLYCNEEMNAEWTTRCRKLNFNAETKTLAGYFKIAEPNPKVMRTNRAFDLKPVS